MYMWYFKYMSSSSTSSNSSRSSGSSRDNGRNGRMFSTSSTLALDDDPSLESSAHRGFKSDRLYYLALIISNSIHLVYNVTLALLTLYSFAIEPIESTPSSSSSFALSIYFLTYCLVSTLILGHSLNVIVYLFLFDTFRHTAFELFCSVSNN